MATPPPKAHPIFNPHITFGALTIGAQISTFLFGFYTLQVYIYFKRFYKDPQWIKVYVVVLWFVELGHMFTVEYALYISMITQYGVPKAPIKPPDSLFVSIVFMGTCGNLVHAFYAYRVLCFSKRWITPLICWVISAFQTYLFSLACHRALKMTSLEQYSKDCQWIMITYMTLGIFIDGLITSTLVCHLLKQKKNAFTRSINVIDKLISWTMETGLVTALTNLTILVLFLSMPQNLIWLASLLIAPRLFSNSLMALLNGRETLCDILHSVELGNKNIFVGPSRSGGSHTGSQPCMDVEINKVTKVVEDTPPHSPALFGNEQKPVPYL